MLAYLFHLLEHTNKLGEGLSVGAIITKGSKGHSGTEGQRGEKKTLKKQTSRSLRGNRRKTDSTEEDIWGK